MLLKEKVASRIPFGAKTAPRNCTEEIEVLLVEQKATLLQPGTRERLVSLIITSFHWQRS
jgi:hypothetical protein